MPPVAAIVLVLAILSWGHAWVGARTLGTLDLSPPLLWAGWAAVIGSAVAVPLGLLSRFFTRGRTSEVLGWIGMVALGVFSLVFTSVVARDLGWFIARLLGLLPADMATRAHLLGQTSAAVLAMSLVAAIFGLYSARRVASVKEVEVPLADLPDALDGFTIVQLSDVHVGPTIRRGTVEGIVDAVNALGADMVAITGDLVDGSVPDLSHHTAPLGRLEARHGTFFVTGNHEYYAGAESWVAELRRLGLRVLLNEHVVLDHEGHPVVIAGVTDYWAGRMLPAHKSDPVGALAGAPDSRVKVLLAHQPKSAHAAVDAGYHLQLSGHTHGGQMIPWNLFVPLQQPFVAGLHRLRDLWVYTSRGTGYWGPPLRVGAPSEITRLRLVRA